MGAEEGSLENIEVNALVLGHPLLETQTEIDHCQLCALSVFLKFANLKDFDLADLIQSNDLTL